MSVNIELSSEVTETGPRLILGISNKGPNTAMAMWKVSLPEGLPLQPPYEPLEGTKDLAASVDAVIGSWTIDLSKLSPEEKADFIARDAKAVGTVTGDGDTYEIGDVTKFGDLLQV